MLLMRWGMPGPLALGAKSITNIRNPTGPHWRRWMGPTNRCLVPANAFCKPDTNKPCVWHWFAREGQSRRPFAFAGVWQPWTGARGTKANLVDGDHLIFSYLTTEPNEIVSPIHQKAMPVILTEDTWDTWLSAPAEEALQLQQPAAAELISIVAKGEKRDPPTPIQMMG
jgi:putative SOS response-associated peptidase YedK